MLQEYEDCVSHCKRLLSLLEEDKNEIADCIQGELLERYRELLKAETEQLRVIERKLLY